MRRRTPVYTALFLGGLLLTGCGGGSDSTDTTDTPPAPTSRAMSGDLSAVTTNLRLGEASGSGADALAAALADVATANGLQTDLQTYTSINRAAAGRATYTKTIGGLTVTLTTTAVNSRSTQYGVTLNGAATASGPAYSNFTFAQGLVEIGRLNGKNGTHQTVTYYQLRNGGQSTTLANADNWFFPDGSGQGGISFTAGAYLSHTYDGSGNWEWAAYSGGDSQTGILRARVSGQSDGSGSAKAYCATDGQVRAEATWSGAQTGQVCLFPTACGTQEGCRAFPR